jgi:DNA repair protein RecO (recombination protein O)
MIVRTEAIVLRAIDYGETSEIVTLFTREGGKVTVIAKGSRSARSRFGSCLQPMSHIEAVYYHRAGRDVQPLSEASFVAANAGINDSLDQLTSGLRIVELLNAMSEVQEQDYEVFDLTTYVLARLAENPDRTINIRLFYELRLAAMLGFEPLIDREQVGLLGEDGGFLHLGDGRISPQSAGLACRRASRGALRAFAILSRAGFADVLRMRLDHKTASDVADLVEDFLKQHVGDAYPGRASRVVRQLGR